MKLVQWTDQTGYTHQSYIRFQDDDRDAAIIGIPYDPPDLDLIDWESVKKDLHNELVSRGLITWRDVQVSQNGLSSAVRRIVTMRIIELFKQQESEAEQKEVENA